MLSGLQFKAISSAKGLCNSLIFENLYVIFIRIYSLDPTLYLKTFIARDFHTLLYQIRNGIKFGEDVYIKLYNLQCPFRTLRNLTPYQAEEKVMNRKV